MNKQNGQEQENEELPDKLLKEGAKAAEEEVKHKVKQQAKKMLAKIGAKIAAFAAAHIVPIILIIAGACILGLLLGAIDNFLDSVTGTAISQITQQTVQEYCTLDDTGVHFDKENFLKSIVAQVMQGDIDLNDLGFRDK